MKALKTKRKRVISSLIAMTILVGGTIMVNKNPFNVVSNVSSNHAANADEGNTFGLNIQQGKITTLVGTGTKGYSGDGDLPTKAELNRPRGIHTDKADNIYIADWANNRIRMVPSENGTYFGIEMEKGKIYTVAGNGESGYSGDNGKASEGQLNYPEGITTDSKGNLYIADTGNYSVRKIDINGTITTVVGTGEKAKKTDDGESKSPTEISLGRVLSLAFDSSDNLYIGEETASMEERRLAYVRKVDLNYGKSAIMTSKDDRKSLLNREKLPIEDVSLLSIRDIIFDNDDNMYIVSGPVFMVPSKDGVNFNIPMKAGRIYAIASSYNSSTYQGDGITGTGVKLGAESIAIDKLGNLYVNNNGLDRNDDKTVNIVDRKSGLISVIAGNGSSEVSEESNIAKDSKFIRTEGIAVNSKGHIYICDDDSKVYSIEPKKLAKNPPTLIQDFNENTRNKPVEFTFKKDKEWKKAVSKVYVNGEDIKRKYKLSDEKLLIEKSIFKTSGIYLIRVEANGYEDNLIIKKINDTSKKLKSDTTNNKVGQEIEITFEDDEDWRNGVIRHSDTYGIFLNGTNISRYEFKEGKLIIDPTMFKKAGKYTIKVVSLGYDESIVNQEILEREKPADIDIALGEIKILAGTGERGSSNDGVLPSEAKVVPADVDVDKSGNIFISDVASQRIKMIPKESGTYYGINMEKGKMYTVAGDGTVKEYYVRNDTFDRTKDYYYSYTGSYGGDGGKAINAKLNNVSSIAVDKLGNLYIADFANNCIRKVDTQGIITTVVGSKGKLPAKHNGIGLEGENEQAKSIAITGVSDLYVNDETDTLYFTQQLGVRKVDLNTGIVTTVTGSKGSGGLYPDTKEAVGDKGLAEDAEFNAILSVDFDKDKNLYIIDQNQIRMIPNESGTYFGTKMTSGNVYTITGHYYIRDHFGDGYLASDARLNMPQDIAIDSRGNIYIAERKNQCIRFISKKSGTIHTIVGKEQDKFDEINSLSIDKDDNLYFIDRTYNKVYSTKISHKE